MMDARLRVRLDRNGTGPDLLGADAGVIDRGLSEHARASARGVGIELVALDHAYTVVFPARCGWFRVMGMRLAMVMMVMVLGAHGDLLQRRHVLLSSA